MTETATVEVEDLVKRYEGRTVLDRLSFTVQRGEIFAILGPNGAGKTTTVEILEGLRRPDGGRARVLGLDPHRDGAALRPRIGVMLQDGGAPPGLTASEVVKLWASLYRDPEPAAVMLERVGLTARARVLVRNLSGGEKQRLSLAMALVGRPQLAFLDEPTVGMDAGARRTTWRAIEDLARSGVTVILTTHYLQEAETLADRVAIVDKGKLLALDTPGRVASLTSLDAMSFATDQTVRVGDLSARLGCPVVREEGVYRIEGRPTPELIAALTAYLAEEGVLVTDLRVGLASLEEAFLHLTGAGTPAAASAGNLDDD